MPELRAYLQKSLPSEKYSFLHGIKPLRNSKKNKNFYEFARINSSVGLDKRDKRSKGTRQLSGDESYPLVKIEGSVAANEDQKSQKSLSRDNSVVLPENLQVSPKNQKQEGPLTQNFQSKKLQTKQNNQKQKTSLFKDEDTSSPKKKIISYPLNTKNKVVGSTSQILDEEHQCNNMLETPDK